MASPVIRALKAEIAPRAAVILDVPPGTGCPTITALHGADVALLVTEPTPFGLHDLAAAVGVSSALGIPVAIVLNRVGVGDDRVERYCTEAGLPIVMRIPFDRAIAAAYAVGRPFVDAFPEWTREFVELGERLEEVAR
jgi:MinD superfamily P-loop ATPase